MDIRELWLRDYVTDDGLGKLNPQDFRPAHKPNKGTTTFFDNGVLVVVTTYYLLDKLGRLKDEDKMRFIRTLFALEYATGIFLRNPNRRLDNGEIELVNAKDNIDAIACGMVLFELVYLTFSLDEIMTHASKYVFLTPKQTGMYKIIRIRPRNPLEVLFVMGGIIVNAFQVDNRGSETILNWLRIEALERLISDKWYPGIKWAIKLWRRRRGNPLQAIRNWYDNPTLPSRDPNHPNIRLAERIWGKAYGSS